MFQERMTGVTEPSLRTLAASRYLEPGTRALRLLTVTAALCFLTACSASTPAAYEEHLYVTLYSAPPPVASERSAPVYHGLAVSQDTGASWRSRGWITGLVNGIYKFERQHDTLFLATDYGVLRSEDGGVTWRQVTTWRVPPVLGFAAHEGTMYAGTAAGVYKSTDRGSTWVAASAGLPDNGARYISGLLATGSDLFAATDNGLWHSSDQGGNWERIAHPEQPLHGIVSHPNQDSLLAVWHTGGGIWLSEDWGATWKWRSDGLRSGRIQCVAFDPHSTRRVLIGTQDFGVFLSEDFGGHWIVAGGGLSNFNITALLFDPRIPGRVYAGAENGTFLSNNGGTQWESFSIRLGHVTSIRVF